MKGQEGFSATGARWETMRKRISITTCRHALAIARWTPAGGIPLDLGGEERVITDVVVRKGRWYSREQRLTRGQQEQLTQRARAVIEADRKRFPRTPPKVSIRECREAILISGGIVMRLGGEERTIREVRTAGGGNTRWHSGDYRLTVREQIKLTELARAIIETNRKG